MPSDPVIIISGGNTGEPSNRVRIVNWDAFIAAVAAQVEQGGGHFDFIDFNELAIPPAFDTGRVYWDANDRTLALMQSNGGADTVIQQIGQEIHVLVRNNTGADIPNGAVIYPSGSVGFRPTIALAQANSLLTSIAAGVTTQTIEKNTEGFVSMFGLVRGMDTQTPGWLEGDRLYLSATVPGGLTKTPPTTGYVIRVGVVLKRHPSDGIIFVRPDTLPAHGNVIGGNYTAFEYDGTMHAAGSATTFRDELQSLASSTLVSPSGDFQLDQAEAAIEAKTSARYPTDYVVTNHQLNHDWKNGSVIFPHLHWWQTTANTPHWVIAHRWQRQGQAKTTAWTPLRWTTNAFTWTSGTLNQISAFGGITPPVGYGQVSDIVQFRVHRDYTNASGLFTGGDPVAASQWMVNFDTHIECDTSGSRGEYTK
jgi:hypothetical protein